MKRSYVVVVVAVALLAIGCGNSDKLEADLASANSRVQELDSLLTDTQSQFQSERETLKGEIRTYKERLANTESERDKLSASLKSTRGEVTKLKGDLDMAGHRYAQALDSLNGVIAMAQTDLQNSQSDLKDALARLDASELRANDLMQTRDSLYAFVDDVQPWFSYYKHQSQRNWLKKLFGAGNAKKPGSPEPTFESESTPADLEVHR